MLSISSTDVVSRYLIARVWVSKANSSVTSWYVRGTAGRTVSGLVDTRTVALPRQVERGIDARVKSNTFPAELHIKSNRARTLEHVSGTTSSYPWRATPCQLNSCLVHPATTLMSMCRARVFACVHVHLVFFLSGRQRLLGFRRLTVSCSRSPGSVHLVGVLPCSDRRRRLPASFGPSSVLRHLQLQCVQHLSMCTYMRGHEFSRQAFARYSRFFVVNTWPQQM